MAGESQHEPAGGQADPTVLTTEQMLLESARQREIMLAEVARVEEVFTEKFAKTKNELDLIELQRVEQKSDTKAAVDAALCMEISTPVLCADLIWRPAGDLKVGDELIAPEETGRKGGRRFVRSTVTGNGKSEADLLRVLAEDGSYVDCNAEHPWLAKRSYGGHAYEWIVTSELRAGDIISRPLLPWNVDESWEAGWLAGILDGEGCLTFKSSGSARVSIGQVAGATANRIGTALMDRAATVGTHTRPEQPYASNGHKGHAQAQQRWQLDTRAEILHLIGSVRPPRLLESADETWEGKTLRCRKNGSVVVKSIDPVGVGVVANVSTTSGTYFGRGWSAHNTAQKRSGQGADHGIGAGHCQVRERDHQKHRATR